MRTGAGSHVPLQLSGLKQPWCETLWQKEVSTEMLRAWLFYKVHRKEAEQESTGMTLVAGWAWLVH